MKTLNHQKYSCKKAFKAGLIFTLALLLVSCDNFVEVPLPKSQLTKVTVFQDYTTANAAMADVFAKIRDRGVLSGTSLGISNLLGNYADELTYYGSPTNTAFAFYSNTVLPSNSTVALFWNSSYNQIYAANAVLEGIAGASFSSQQKAQLQGEALFVRGLLHFYLLQLFGDVPYIRSTDYAQNNVAARMPSEQVYQNIITDLNAAAEILLPAYPTAERVRPNSFVVKALLARVYLYKKAFNEAEKMSSAVIGHNAVYGLEANLAKVFLKNSTETLWQFMPAIAGKNTDEGLLFTFTSGPPSNVALSEQLINFFGAGDLRKSQWTTTVSNTKGTWYHASKYKEPRVSAVSNEYSIVLRLAEQYLIRAEARAELGDLNGASEDLNKIRKRAGLLDVVASSKQQLLDAILQERRKELFTEYAHRFFDLKRMDKLDGALSVKAGWNTSDRLLPIPESELIVNPNLKPQNPGY